MSLLECSFNTTILLTPKHTQSKMIYIQIKNRFKIGPIKTKDTCLGIVTFIDIQYSNYLQNEVVKTTE